MNRIHREVPEYLKEAAIKFRPVRPRSAHLNGKVERVQKSVLDELYATMDPETADIEDEPGCYQHDYNWYPPNGAHSGKTPMDRYSEKSSRTPFRDDAISFLEGEMRPRVARGKREAATRSGKELKVKNNPVECGRQRADIQTRPRLFRCLSKVKVMPDCLMVTPYLRSLAQSYL